MSAISSANLAGSQLGAEVSLAVAVKAQDAAKAQGDAAISLLQDAARLQQQITVSQDPHRGKLLDILG